MHIQRIASHTAQAALEAALVASLVVGLVAGTALAAKGGGAKPSAGSGTIELVLMDGATAAEYGNRVTFRVATTSTASPFVHLMCYQGGAMVLQGWQGFFDTALGNEWFFLGPSGAWQGGAADCTANLEKKTKRGWAVLASTTFHVQP